MNETHDINAAAPPNGRPKSVRAVRARDAGEYQAVKATLDEGNRARFERVATRRTKAAVKALRSLGTMGGRSYYEFTQPDVDRIVERLAKELNTMTVRLVPAGRQTDIEFDFK